MLFKHSLRKTLAFIWSIWPLPTIQAEAMIKRRLISASEGHGKEIAQLPGYKSFAFQGEPLSRFFSTGYKMCSLDYIRLVNTATLLVQNS